MPTLIRKTRSVCPVCKKNLAADLLQANGGSIWLVKDCPDHGRFRTIIWRGCIDFDQWTAGAEALPDNTGVHCPSRCGLCPEHESETCCILLEVTLRCNLQCTYCFANGKPEAADPSVDELKAAITDIASKCNKPLIQFSGGEPTLRDDLPELVRFAKEAGCSYTQINTNGLRLAKDKDYVSRLKEAGLDIVFLQFDGTKNEIYKALRGRALLKTKLEAIQACSEFGIGVTLVPTVVKGVNEDNLGDLIRLAASLSPAVRGVHFQPVSYFGRYPGSGADAEINDILNPNDGQSNNLVPEEGTCGSLLPDDGHCGNLLPDDGRCGNLPLDAERYTLDQLITDICDQAAISPQSFLPSRCDHPLCGFHASFLVESDYTLTPLSSFTHSSHSKGCAKDNREYIARRWMRPAEEPVKSAGLASAGSSGLASAGSSSLASAGASGLASAGASDLASAGASGLASAGASGLTSAGASDLTSAGASDLSANMDFDTFLYRLRHTSLTLTAMAFQDAGNFNIERLRRCSLHVYEKGRILPFCAKYLT